MDDEWEEEVWNATNLLVVPIRCSPPEATALAQLHEDTEQFDSVTFPKCWFKGQSSHQIIWLLCVFVFDN